MSTLMLLPGLDGTGLLFQPFVERLAPEISPLVIRYPGDAELGYDELLPTVERQLPSGPFVLLGESFSGPLAIMVANARPPGLRGLVLCASFARSPVAFVPGWAAHLVRPFMFRLYPVVARLRMLLGRFSDPATRRLAEEAVASVQPRVLAHRIREVHRVDVSEQLRSCGVPVLYLRGGHDLLVRRSSLRRVLRCSPHARVCVLPAPHMVLQSAPAAAGQVVSEFVRSVCAA